MRSEVVTDAYRHGRAAGGPQRATGKRATTEASAHQKSKRVTGVVARAAGRRRQDPSAPPVGGLQPDLRAIRTKAEDDSMFWRFDGDGVGNLGWL